MTAERNPVNTWIVDDDNVYAYGFKKLVSIKGFSTQISHFSNGVDAIGYLKNPDNANNLPDVIFLDINMPVMDGWEFMEEFAEIKSHTGKNITVYIISSSIDLNDIYHAKNISAVTDYIFKPVNEHQLAGIFEIEQEKTDARILKYGA